MDAPTYLLLCNVGIPDTLVELIRSAQPSTGPSPLFIPVCMHALARICSSNAKLCKKLVKSHDLVGMSFRKLNTGQ
jgi:hypothetical protein